MQKIEKIKLHDDRRRCGNRSFFLLALLIGCHDNTLLIILLFALLKIIRQNCGSQTNTLLAEETADTPVAWSCHLHSTISYTHMGENLPVANFANNKNSADKTFDDTARGSFGFWEILNFKFISHER